MATATNRAMVTAARAMVMATKKTKAARAMATATKKAMVMAVRVIVTATKMGDQRRQVEW